MMLNRLGCANIDTGNKRQKYACLHGSKFSLPDEDEAGQEEEEEQVEDEKKQQVRKHEEEQDMMKEQHQDSQHMAVMATMQEMSNAAQFQAAELKRLRQLVSNPAFVENRVASFVLMLCFVFVSMKHDTNFGETSISGTCGVSKLQD